MKKSNPKLKKEILQYMLNDFQFLQDYEIIENCKYNKNTFIAQIKNSTQKVRFLKKKFSEEYFNRFKGLYKLYKNGIVLADNMFIIQECEQLFFYIIEAELEMANSRFRNLQQFLYQKRPNTQQRKSIVSKIKILVDCLHQQGQTFAGLDPRSIIVDDENHLYLVPFQLEYQLKTDNYTTAYYPPEVLQTINEGKLQIDQSNIVKWDYWAFGCIIAEVLLYGSPLFLDTSQSKQLKRIKQFAIGEEIAGLQEPLKNVIFNSLQKDPQKRNVSTNGIAETKISEVEQDLKKTIKHGKKMNSPNEDSLSELNLYLDKQIGDSELILSLLSLQNIEFKDELHIVVCLNKKYHFYIDYQQQSNKYKLSKKITIRDNFHSISKLLSQPIRVQLKEKGQITPILVNLQTLVIVQDKRRIWNKKLLGTYKPNKSSNHSQAKIKISCILNSPQTYVQEYQIKEQASKDTQPQQLEAIKEPTEIKVLNQVTNNVPNKKSNSKTHSSIPSISQISNNITTITQQFMHKLSQRQQNQDRAKCKQQKNLES